MNQYVKFVCISIFFIILFILILIYWICKNETTIHQLIYPSYYKDRFPEEKFLPVNPKKYYKRVKEGYKIMKNSSLAVIGLAYNLGEEKTHKLMKRLSYLVKKWKDYRIIIYAIDSDDNTFSILSSYKNKKYFFLQN